ncbi:hypothetical protein CDD80_4556 [Ophiocordyceps camponoti-rufipedis]|uniref:Uncharacterized protein n=1 Tax=Ophiocordyceps camponoti-rufipedis TaxID=2004952 RepID=A0A2C5YXR2_9HYPO|nr:hypothetical protein CDD80_4556 [Ophiocordyceps camponoti-rufipedis]
MMNTIEIRQSATLVAPAWVTPDMDVADDVDEPPEIRLQQPSPQRFQRTAIRPPADHSSLLTKAIMGHSDDDHYDYAASILANSHRRRSMTSNVSVASTADLTSDTGLTSPSRTNTPSPPIPELQYLRLDSEAVEFKQDAPKKRCIQFACAAKPQPLHHNAPRPAPAALATPAPTPAVPRRSCIKFACPSVQAPVQRTDTEPSQTSTAPVQPIPRDPSPQPPSPREPVDKTALSRPQFLRVNSKDPHNDASQFHEFASGTAREDDWIRKCQLMAETRLTINDTLTKENRFRRLGAEAEEEAEMEDQEDDAAADDEADEADADDDNDDDGDDQDDDSDGYSTDEETGFAESDDEDDEDENMTLWTPGRVSHPGQSIAVASARKSPVAEPQSDSSAATTGNARRIKPRRHRSSSDTPDLPDSTDFVCGTLDEDRPLEEAYVSCLAARRNGKLRIIPQDIDPSFPASDPDDDDDDQDMYNPVAHDSDNDVLFHGEMEDLHHGQDRSRRRRRCDHHGSPPRKYRSPAPKRHHSPPPPMKRHHSPPPLHKSRTRSPKTLFGRHSPRRTRSPAPRALTTPVGSPRQGPHVQFQLAGRPNTTLTKSLPRPAALFRHVKKDRAVKTHHDSDVHVRGAIDIVKGLERKRQRRKEKFYQKYCNRARRGQIPERKPQPGRGAERMKELGLLMAGKKDQGNYVLSI